MFKLVSVKDQVFRLRVKKFYLHRFSFFLVTFSLFVALHYFFVPTKEVVSQSTNIAAVWNKASFPVENFQAYTSPFGYRTHPITGRRQFHNGLDIAAPLGSYIRSWWGGRVVSMSDHTGCGTMLTIQSGGWSHTYCHMMGKVENTNKGRVLVDRNGGIFIWQGQDVPSGARIGRIGMTGRTTGPHLHWELKYNGARIDPGDVLRKMYAQRS